MLLGTIYLILLRKPGVLRNSAPFKDWDLPPAFAQVRARLKHHADGDRQFINVLACIPEHSVERVWAAFLEALDAGIAHGDVILAVFARQIQPPVLLSITTQDALVLTVEPVAACARYDRHFV